MSLKRATFRKCRGAWGFAVIHHQDAYRFRERGEIDNFLFIRLLGFDLSLFFQREVDL